MRSYPKPAVSAVIINSEKKVLLTLRSSRVLAPGTWCLPGGHLEGGQDWLQGLRQEVQEEVGLAILEPRLAGIYSDPQYNCIDEKNGDSHYFLVASFLITSFRGEVIVNEESERFGWFSPDALPSPMLKSEPIKIQDAVVFQGVPFVR